MELCIYDRLVYLNTVKKGIKVFSKKRFLRGWGHNVAKGGQKCSCTPLASSDQKRPKWLSIK